MPGEASGKETWTTICGQYEKKPTLRDWGQVVPAVGMSEMKTVSTQNLAMFWKQNTGTTKEAWKAELE